MDWPHGLSLAECGQNHITTYAPHVAAIAATGLASAVWPTANLAIFCPLRIATPRIARKLWWANGAAVSGNVDCGIYDVAGTKIVSTGSTVQAGTTAIQTVDITDTMLGSGLFYLALVLDNVTGTTRRFSISATFLQVMGLAQQGTAFALPATATFASIASGYLPEAGIVFDLAGI